MLFFIVVFCIIGFVIGIVLNNSKIAMTVIGVITIGWAFAFGPWALATLIELMVGYAVGKEWKKR